MTPEVIAQVCHEVNKSFCEAGMRDFSQLSWDEAPQWQILSSLNGVHYILDNPNATPESTHENWLKEKIKDGWKYGLWKDVKNKLHPCILPYDQLPLDQRVKDHLFRTVVKTLAKLPDCRG